MLQKQVIMCGGLVMTNGSKTVSAKCARFINPLIPTDQWITDIPDMPAPRYKHNMFAVGDRFVVIGGLDENNETVTTLFQFNFTEKSWSIRNATFPAMAGIVDASAYNVTLSPFEEANSRSSIEAINMLRTEASAKRVRLFGTTVIGRGGTNGNLIDLLPDEKSDLQQRTCSNWSVALM